MASHSFRAIYREKVPCAHALSHSPGHGVRQWLAVVHRSAQPTGSSEKEELAEVEVELEQEGKEVELELEEMMEEEEEEEPAAKCPLCDGPAGHKGYVTFRGIEFCERAAGGHMTVQQWMKTWIPRTTRWRLEKKWKAMQAGCLPPPKPRTCNLCGQRTLKATGHSTFRKTRETFCSQADPERRTVEQWLTEKRGGISTAALYKSYGRTRNENQRRKRAERRQLK
ncbi:uncharacterized protein LOC144522665 isoform X2 [Sander vitreus]